MTITVSGASITFPDATVQTTAAASGFSGATVTSSAVDITLTSASAQTQAVSMTATGKYVILPNATTLLTKGGPIFIIQNKGQNPFGIKDASGNVIANMVYYGQSVSLVLLSNAASAGSWGTQDIGSAGVAGIGPINASTISYRINGVVATCGLSSTQALLVYANTANTNYQIVLATISGSTVTYGTPTTLYASSQPNNCYGTVALSSSLAVFLVASSSGTPQLIAVSVSGSTITVGTAVAVSAAGFGTARTTVYQESATAGVVVYSTESGATNTYSVVGFTVSGTTITLGTAQNLISVTSGLNINGATVKLATGSYVSIYADTSATLTGYARPWTSSAGTVTLGTATSYANTTTQYTNITYAAQTGGGFGASSTCGVFSYAGYSVTVVTSGTTIASTTAQYGPNTAGNSTIGMPSPFGTSGVLTPDGSYISAYTGSANGFGGAVTVGASGLTGIGTYANYSYLDSTTNLFAGNYNGLVAAVVVKGN